MRIDNKIFSGLSLSFGCGVGDSMRPRKTDAADPPRCCDDGGPVDVEEEDCGGGGFEFEVDTNGDFGK